MTFSGKYFSALRPLICWKIIFKINLSGLSASLAVSEVDKISQKPVEPEIQTIWCFCRVPCENRTVDKESKNFGRKYVVCANGKCKVCHYFRFSDVYYHWDLKKQGDLRNLVLIGVTWLWHVTQWVSRAPLHHTLAAFLNLNGMKRKFLIRKLSGFETFNDVTTSILYQLSFCLKT